MVDRDTFLTLLYVMVDDFCQSQLAPGTPPGPAPSLSDSEVLTLALFGQFSHFQSERGFYRYASHHLRPAFPRLPDRSQFNRLVRTHWPQLVAFFHFLVAQLQTKQAPYEALDSTGIATRNAQRRGRGWLVGQANKGYCTRLGWYEGCHLLLAVQPEGILTGWGFGPASAKDQPLAETFLAQRAQAIPTLPTVGTPASGPYVADKGFSGAANHQRWWQAYGALVLCARQRQRKSDPQPTPKALRRWLASHRQIIETVNDKLLNTFRLGRERPHDLTGFQARLAAKMALHNFCIWLNEQLGRPRLAFADLVDW
jgi:Transposase DDE domain